MCQSTLARLITPTSSAAGALKSPGFPCWHFNAILEHSLFSVLSLVWNPLNEPTRYPATT